MGEISRHRFPFLLLVAPLVLCSFWVVTGQLHSAAEAYVKEGSPESGAVVAAALTANEEHRQQMAERKARTSQTPTPGSGG